MKRFISLFLSLVFVLSLLSALPLSAQADDPISIENAEITLVEQTYSDKGLPFDTFKIKVVVNSVELTESVDYQFVTDYYESYTDDEAEYYICIEGINGYTGTARAEFSAPYAVSGRAGESAEWSYNKDTGVLSVTGSGTLASGIISIFYDDMKHLNIGSGITALSKYNFSLSEQLKDVTIPESVKVIGFECFASGNALNNISIGYGVKTIKSEAFLDVPAKQIYVPASVTKIGKYAFGYRLVDEADYYSKPKFVLCGAKGSAAAKYAKKNGFKFVAFNPTEMKSVTEGKGSFKASWKYTFGVNGYQLQFSTNKFFNKNNKTVKCNGISNVGITVSGLSSNKKYYVRVRTYKKSGGKIYYSCWTKTEAVKTK